MAPTWNPLNSLIFVSDRLEQSSRDQIFFVLLAVFLTFLILAMVASGYTTCWLMTLMISLTSVAAAVYTLIAGVHMRKEKNALKATISSIHVLIEQKG